MEAQEIEYTNEQLAAVQMAVDNRVSVLTGGPGTGKTTTVKKILSTAYKNGWNVIQCAPTGKAAKRMSEATGHEAMTIHRTLGAMVNDDGEFCFGFNEDQPLPCNFLIADEMSMVTNALLADLLRAIDTDKTRVLFVGDSGQLPSVGTGAVLRDLLQSQCVPHVELTKIHRNAGEIVKSCHQIAKGLEYEPCNQLDLEAGKNLRHIETDIPVNIKEVIQMIIQKMASRGYDPIWDCQVISPVNSRGELSCDALNSVLQDQLNPQPDEHKTAGCKFRFGDKVIQTKNKKVKTTDGEDSYIVNGDIGKVVRFMINEGYMNVQFSDPDRTVKMPKNEKHLLLAYAITCHRAQGSEAPVVIVPVHAAFRFFMNRNWLYTAISRSRDICFTVGTFRSIRQAIEIEETWSRKTFLAEKIVETVL